MSLYVVSVAGVTLQKRHLSDLMRQFESCYKNVVCEGKSRLSCNFCLLLRQHNQCSVQLLTLTSPKQTELVLLLIEEKLNGIQINQSIIRSVVTMWSDTAGRVQSHFSVVLQCTFSPPEGGALSSVGRPTPFMC